MIGQGLGVGGSGSFSDLWVLCLIKKINDEGVTSNVSLREYQNIVGGTW